MQSIDAALSGLRESAGIVSQGNAILPGATGSRAPEGRHQLIIGTGFVAPAILSFFRRQGLRPAGREDR